MPTAGTSIPAAPVAKTTCGDVRPSRMSRRRALVLVLVHVAIAAHIAHWWITGRSVTPVEPSEAQELITYGVINAGAILLGLSVLSTLVLGRWFCGWACHVVALQDLCAWMLGKLGIRPRPVRARLLMLVPLLAAIDVFLMPRILRWIDGAPMPGLHAELTTDALWETFPGPWMTGLTLLVDGFLVVYLLGAKGFCTYGCPYGAIFGFAERFAKGRIRVNDACEGCGHCTATCTSNVDVRAEVARFGMVVDSGCMKCMDCVSVCPKNALSFGFGGVPEKARGKPLKPTRRWDFSWAEEALMAAVFLGAGFAFRGLYEAVPLLLAVGLGVIVSFATVLGLRVLQKRDVVYQALVLRRGGRLTGGGFASVGLAAVLLAFAGHSGYVQAQTRLGRWELARADAIAESPQRGAPEMTARMEAALAHLLKAERAGLVELPSLHNQLGSLYLGLGRLEDAEPHLRRAIDLDDAYVNTRVRLAELLMTEQRLDEAVDVLAQALERAPTHPMAGRRAYDLVSLAPEMPGPRLLVVDYLIATGDLENARNALAPLLEHIPDHPNVVRRAEALERAEAEAQP